MSTTDEFRANRLVWRFLKSGANGRWLKAFRELDDSARQRVAALAHIEPPEVAAIGLLRADDDWVLITSRRVVWCGDGQVQEVPFQRLRDATIHSNDLAAAGTKSGVDVLTLETTDSQRMRIELEAGPPLSGAWNALKMTSGWRDPE